jgi:hypothetical protein
MVTDHNNVEILIRMIVTMKETGRYAAIDVEYLENKELNLVQVRHCVCYQDYQLMKYM